jgi:hypothetical protein
MPTTMSTVESLLTRTARWGFRLLAGVALVIGAMLVCYPGDTAAYFAWTIKAPIAAVTLGAWFLGLSGFTWALAGGPVAAMRLAAPAVALGSTLMLVTTILHRTAFNWGSLAAWAWLFLYIGGPLSFTAFAYLLGKQGALVEAPPRSSALLRGAAAAAAAIAGVFGAMLFLWPSALIPSWPWPLLPLGARTYAAFVLGHALWAGRVACTHTERSGADWYLALFPVTAFLAPWLQSAGFRPWSAGGVTFLILTGGLAALTACALRVEGRRSRQNT